MLLDETAVEDMDLAVGVAPLARECDELRQRRDIRRPVLRLARMAVPDDHRGIVAGLDRARVARLDRPEKAIGNRLDLLCLGHRRSSI